MRNAKPGMRVANRFGDKGVIQSLNRSEALVKWDDGFQCYVLVDKLHAIEGPRWGLRILCAAVALSALILAVALT